MDNEKTITLSQVLLSLRKHVLEAKEQNDYKSLGDYLITLDVLEEVVTEMGDVAIATILEDMVCSIRDYLTGVDWKSSMPSIEDVKKATG